MRLKITALAGGVGGAKLAHSLAQILPLEDLSVIVNAGEDVGLYDTVLKPDEYRGAVFEEMPEYKA